MQNRCWLLSAVLLFGSCAKSNSEKPPSASGFPKTLMIVKYSGGSTSTIDSIFIGRLRIHGPIGSSLTDSVWMPDNSRLTVYASGGDFSDMITVTQENGGSNGVSLGSGVMLSMGDFYAPHYFEIDVSR